MLLLIILFASRPNAEACACEDNNLSCDSPPFVAETRGYGTPPGSDAHCVSYRASAGKAKHVDDHTSRSVGRPAQAILLGEVGFVALRPEGHLLGCVSRRCSASRPG